MIPSKIEKIDPVIFSLHKLYIKYSILKLFVFFLIYVIS